MKQNVTPGVMVAAVVLVVAILALGFYFTQSRLPPPPPIPNMPTGPQSGMVPPGSQGPGAGASQPQSIPGMGGGGIMPGAPPTPGGGAGMMPGAPPTPGGP